MKKIYLFTLVLVLASFLGKAQITPPYFTDFSTVTTSWWVDSISGSKWEYGLPAFDSSYGKAMGVSLDTLFYLPSSLTYLYTPEFNFSNTLHPEMNVDLNFNTIKFEDGTSIEYTANNGLSWFILGSSFSPNWYNTYIIVATGLSGWSGNDAIWAHRNINLDSLAGLPNVQFRFKFASDPAIESQGFQIDNFCVCDTPNCNCSNTVSIVKPDAIANTLKIYPNPAKEILSIQHPLFNITNCKIINILDNEITIAKNQITKNKDEKQLNISSLASGIYLLQLIDEKGNFYSAKFVKE